MTAVASESEDEGGGEGGGADKGVAVEAWGWNLSVRARCKKGCRDRGRGNWSGKRCWPSECSGFSGEHEYGGGDQPGTDTAVVEGDCTASPGTRPLI